MQRVAFKVTYLRPEVNLNWKTCILLSALLSRPLMSAPLNINEAWESNSSPEIMSYFFAKKIDELPLAGSVTNFRRYWSGDYWALRSGSINYRWYAQNKIGFNLNSPPREMALRMSIPELASLSPSEKYDLFTGRYDYPLRNEVSLIADPKAEAWEGMCHGWSPATMNHDEPSPKLMINPDGIEIPFGSTDIKALLSYYYAYNYQAPDTHQMGRRCFKGSFFNNDKDCQEDLNAGAFHIVLTNRIGIDGKGLIADLHRYKEVWNHPITSYKSEIQGVAPIHANAAPETNRVLKIKTTITYLDENGHDWHPVIGTNKQATKELTYFYNLELNSGGEIIGGVWISKQRPDFLWLMNRPRKFEGTLYRLGELLDD